MDYARYPSLAFDNPSDRVLRITINRPERMNAPGCRRAWGADRGLA